MLTKKSEDINFESIPISQFKLFDLLKIQESRLELSRNVDMPSLREVQFYFDILLDPNRGISALQQLYHISLNMRFSIKEQYFTNLLQLTKNLFNGCPIENIQSENDDQSSLSPEEIKEMCLRLIYTMVSFPRFYVNQSEIKLHHITDLYNLLPDPLAFKILGKLICFNVEIATHVVNLGIDRIITYITEDNAPLFIYFLGSIATFQQLNSSMIQFYDAFIIHNSISSNDTIRKYSYDAISLLCRNSIEMLQYISQHELFLSIFTIPPETRSTLIKLIELITILLKHEITHFLKNNPNCIVFEVLTQCFSDTYQLADRAVPIIYLLMKFGFMDQLLNSKIDETIYQLVFASIPFQQKEAAMKAACLFFINSVREYKVKYFNMGLIEILKQALDNHDFESELHKIAFCAFRQLVNLSNENSGNEELQNCVESIVEVLNPDEFAEIQDELA